MSDDTRKLSIALSAGGATAELAAHGLGQEHIDELMVRVAMALLRDARRLAFGGTLGDKDKDLTRNLIQVTTDWVGQQATGNSKVNEPATWPLINYTPWPNHAAITDEQQARLVGICQFVTVYPPGCDPAKLKGLIPTARQTAEGKLRAAQALTAMRERSTRETDLRVVWGGKIAGASGWMAGILEEVGCSLRQGKPVLILGGFGGCARVLADYLKDPAARWPAALSLASCADRERDALLTDAQRAEVQQHFTQIQQDLDAYRTALHSQPVANGLPATEIVDALTTESSRDAIRLATQAARNCVSSG